MNEKKTAKRGRIIVLDEGKYGAAMDRLSRAIGRPVYMTDVAHFIEVERATIYNWLSGKHAPTAANMAALMDFFGVTSIDDLFSLSGPKPRGSVNPTWTTTIMEKRTN